MENTKSTDFLYNLQTFNKIMIVELILLYHPNYACFDKIRKNEENIPWKISKQI